MTILDDIQELIPLLPPELCSAIRNRCVASRARHILLICERCIGEERSMRSSRPCIDELPNLAHPWYTPVHFTNPHPWTPLFYVYLWYLFNTYHMSVVFDPKSFQRWRRLNFQYTLFDKFWFHVFGEDWRVVAAGRSVLHPLRRPLRRAVTLIVKMNYMEDSAAGAVQRLPPIEWVRNPDGSFHRHEGLEEGYHISCQTAIWRADNLNTGVSHDEEDIASTPDVHHEHHDHDQL